MKTSKIALIAALATLALPMIVGCASSSGVVFGRDEARQAHTILEGTVTDVREGKIEGSKSAVGALAGGAMGGVVGNLFGGGKAKNVTTVGGAIAGAAGGAALEEGATSKKGIQITVRLDNGQTVVIVQEADVMFAVGQRVRVLSRPGGKDRVQAL